MYETFANFLEKSIGDAGKIDQQTKVGRLPFHITDTYDLRYWSFRGTDVVLAFFRPQKAESPGAIAKHVELLKEKTGHPIVVVLPEVTAYNRARLIKRRVPFVVPQRQMYLPDLLIDLRETFSAENKPKQHLLPSAQLIIFYHLLKAPLDNRTMSELAVILDYTPTSINRAVKNLTDNGLCAVRRDGRERKIEFELGPSNLWNRAEGLMRSPVKSTICGIEFKSTIDAPLPLAGLSALSEHSLVADNPQKTVAITEKDYKKLVERGKVIPPDDPPAGAINMEVWRYDPNLLAHDGAVDPLSLYLSLMDIQDERIEVARDELLVKVLGS